MPMQWFDEEETAEINRNIIPTHFVGSIPRVPNPTTPDQLMPLLRLDTTNRPDIEDFFRVLHAEGLPSKRMPPPISTARKSPGFLLRFHTDDPAPCTFNIFLRWPEDETVLTLMAASGMLCVFAGAEYRHDRGVCTTVNKDDLAQMIRVWKYHSQED